MSNSFLVWLLMFCSYLSLPSSPPLQLCLIVVLWFLRQPWRVPSLLLNVHHLRGVGSKRAAGVVFLACFRTVDSSLGPAVSTIFLLPFSSCNMTTLSYICAALWVHNSQICPCCPSASPANTLSEPSCDVISKAQKLQDEAERSWALSQACAYYQQRCRPGDLDKESCIRIMGESCSARVLQCSLLNTMQSLEPATQTHVQGEYRPVLMHL